MNLSTEVCENRSVQKRVDSRWTDFDFHFMDRALTNCVPRFYFSFASFLFLFFPSISIEDVGATAGVFLLFPNEFLLCDHRLDFLGRLIM